MNLIRIDKILIDLPSEYKKQYPHNYQLFDGRWSDDIQKMLEAEKPLTEEKVIEITGNHSWVTNKCDECSQKVSVSVSFGGNNGEDENGLVNICVDCLRKAINLIVL